MKIKEFAEKFDLTPRDIDYYTTLGIFKPIVDESNRYRDYTEEDERAAEYVLIAKAMGVRPIEEYVRTLQVLPKREWQTFVISRIEEEIRKRVQDLYRAKDLAEKFAAE